MKLPTLELHIQNNNNDGDLHNVAPHIIKEATQDCTSTTIGKYRDIPL